MVGEDALPEVVSQLEAALESADSEETDFHVRQALQLLEVEGGVDETERGDGELKRSDGNPEQSGGAEN